MLQIMSRLSITEIRGKLNQKNSFFLENECVESRAVIDKGFWGRYIWNIAPGYIAGEGGFWFVNENDK